jgi:peptidylprolyl isomerase
LDDRSHIASCTALLPQAPAGFASFGELRAPAGREEEAHALLISCWLNEAQCALQREEWFAAEKLCSTVRRARPPPRARRAPAPTAPRRGLGRCCSG